LGEARKEEAEEGVKEEGKNPCVTGTGEVERGAEGDCEGRWKPIERGGVEGGVIMPDEESVSRG
jgi:hypothetical protein